MHIVDKTVVKVLTDRLDQIEEQIKPLEKEYRAIAEHLQEVEKQPTTKVCSACGKEDDKKYFFGTICLECFRESRKKPKAEKKEKKVVKKSIDQILIEARAKGMTYGQYVEEMETKRGI